MLLDTIQKKEKLNKVETVDEENNSSANYEYRISDNNDITITYVNFQNGARNSKGSSTGVLDQDLLEISRHRLKCFQEGEYACKYNEKALEHIEEALRWLNKRVEDRIKRQVLGTMNK